MDHHHHYYYYNYYYYNYYDKHYSESPNFHHLEDTIFFFDILQFEAL